MRALRVLAALALVALAVAAPAAAHTGGKAEPRIAAAVRDAGKGLERILTVRLTDVDSGDPVTGATVTAAAEMIDPHLMRLAPWPLAAGKPGIYRARVQFVMPAKWALTIAVTGSDVVPASARLTVEIKPPAGGLGPPISAPALIGAPPPAGQAPGLQTLPTRLEEAIGNRDILTMAILWLHGLSALGWIAGVVLMAVALSAQPAVLAESVRGRVATAYRRWGAWVHWGFVAVVVGTGVYNLFYVTPFDLVSRPGGFSELAAVPYGRIYEAILFAKLGLFLALLVTGTRLLARTVRPPTPAPGSGGGAIRTLARALGPAGLFYLACVPLILGAAAALRYVHILSHVARVLSTS